MILPRPDFRKFYWSPSNISILIYKEVLFSHSNKTNILLIQKHAELRDPAHPLTRYLNMASNLFIITMGYQCLKTN
jgi:hypothetical protein